jgi:hypothetical protein
MDLFSSLPTNVQQLTESFYRNVYGLSANYSWKYFQFYSLFQSFVYPLKVDRIDETKNKMKFLDFGLSEERAQEEVKQLIRAHYKRLYEKDLQMKVEQEKLKIVDLLIDKLLNTELSSDISHLLKNGLTFQHYSIKFSNAYSQGFPLFLSKLLDEQIPCKNRQSLLLQVLLGCDSQGNSVFNNGNVYYTEKQTLKKFKQLLLDSGMKEEEFAAVKADYMARRRRAYRQQPNRNGHSNVKPSFFSLGYPTLGHMKKSVSEAEWKDYEALHNDCCGLDKGVDLSEEAVERWEKANSQGKKKKNRGRNRDGRAAQNQRANRAVRRGGAAS